MPIVERIDGPIEINLESIRRDIAEITKNTTYLGAEITVNSASSPCVFFRETPNGRILYIYADGYLIYQTYRTDEIDVDAVNDLINQNLCAEALLIEIDRKGIYRVLKTY